MAGLRSISAEQANIAAYAVWKHEMHFLGPSGNILNPGQSDIRIV